MYVSLKIRIHSFLFLNRVVVNVRASYREAAARMFC